MTETPEALAIRLRDTWIAFGVRVMPGVSADELDAFERRHGVRLPADLRALLQVVNGFEEHYWDEEMVEWYPLSRWERMAEAFSIGEELEFREEYFLFGDYCFFGWIFGVRLHSDPEVENTVIGHIGGERPYWRIAGSFIELMEAYLRDTTIMLGP